MNYRHGDIALIGIKNIPDKLKESKTKVLHDGKSHTHSFDEGTFYKKSDGFIIGYFRAKNTTLFHPEHGKIVKGKSLKEAKIKDGCYEVRVQQEITHEGMKPVID